MPEPFRSPRWDVTVFSANPSMWRQMPSFQAAHGMDCTPPPALHMPETYDLASTAATSSAIIVGSDGGELEPLADRVLVDPDRTGQCTRGLI
jgi:hypothetical protein